MVNYAYEDLFENHETVDVVMLAPGGTLTWDTETHTFVVGNSPFAIYTDDIVEQEFELDERLCSEENLKWGLCESAHLNFTFFNRDDIPNLEDETIKVFIYFDGNPSTLFTVGSYIVDEDTRSDDRLERSISAFDLMYTLRDYDISEWYYGSDDYEGFFKTAKTTHTINECIESLFAYLRTYEELNIQLASGQTLVNGDFVIGKTIESDTITFSFFMQRLLEVNGVFGHIGRDGKFYYIKVSWYDQPPMREIVDDVRIPPTPYNDISTWGIGQILVYDRNNTRLFKQRNTAKKYPSTYYIVDSFVFADKKKGNAATKEALRKLQEEVIWHINYRPCEVTCIGDLCLEVGDRIDVLYHTTDEEDDDPLHKFRSIIMERHITGLEGMEDVYIARGDKKQPKYKITNDNWHNGDSSKGLGMEGVSEVTDDFDEHYIEKMRNVGQRVLDEPSGVSVQFDSEGMAVKIKWVDPEDLTDDAPKQCEWAGTYIVRSEDSPPWNIYQGTIIKDSTTRDEFSDEWFVDDTVVENKNYYYGIFPYDTDGNVRWTKVMSVNTNIYIEAPTIESIESGSQTPWDGTEIEIMSSGEDNTLTVQISDSHYVFTLYTEDTPIYSFQSPIGSTPADAKKIHVAFLQDTENEVAKPSFVYHTGSGIYSYNQESPSASEMADIYTWLQAGL